MPELVVATFNMHAGIDGWGVPFDVVECCGQIDADVLVLQETWTPSDGEGLAGRVARSLGYEVHEFALADALLLESAAPAGKHWGPSRGYPVHSRHLWVGEAAELNNVRRWRGDYAPRPGTWGIAVLSRLETRRVEAIDLGRLPRDSASRRAGLVAEIALESSSVTVVGTHLAHFMHGSPVIFERLRSKLPGSDQPAVLAGDMNFWGPPLSLALPGWRRAVRARTFPSWGAHSQIDHIFVTRPVEVVSGEAVSAGNSDHLPLRARLRVE